MKLKVSSITGIGNECKILMVHLLSMEIILFSLLFANRSKFFPYSSNKDLSVIKTSLFYFSVFTNFIFYLFFFIYYYFLFLFFFFFLKSGQNSTKFAIDTNFVTYCLNYFVSGMPFEGLANSNVSSLL